MVLLAGLAYGSLPTLAGKLRPGACREWASREVPLRELGAEDLVALRRETRVVRVPSYMAAWPRDGISLPGLVAVSDRRALSSSDDLLWHELVHQRQYREDGSLRFMARYVADWHRGLFAGCGFDEAYLAIGYELETEALLREMRLDLGGIHSDAFERIAIMIVDPSVRIPYAWSRRPAVPSGESSPFVSVSPPRYPDAFAPRYYSRPPGALPAGPGHSLLPPRD